MPIQLVLQIDTSGPSLGEIEEFARLAKVLGVPATNFPFRGGTGHQMTAYIDLDRVVLALENYDA